MNILKPVSTMAVAGTLLVGNLAFADIATSATQHADTFRSCIQSAGSNVSPILTCTNTLVSQIQNTVSGVVNNISIPTVTIPTISASPSTVGVGSATNILPGVNTLTNCVENAGTNASTMLGCVNSFTSSVSSGSSSSSGSSASAGTQVPAAITQDAATFATCLQNAIQGAVTSGLSSQGAKVDTSAAMACKDTFTSKLTQGINGVVSSATNTAGATTTGVTGIGAVSGADVQSLIQSIKDKIASLLAQIQQITQQTGQSRGSDGGVGVPNISSLTGGLVNLNDVGGFGNIPAIAGGTDGSSNVGDLSDILSDIFNRTLRKDSRGDDVSKLQKCLAKEDDNDDFDDDEVTGFFGPLTQAALQKWQSKHGIVSEGDPLTTGFGLFGPKTRAAFKDICR